jgi:uncharacterized OB-fold protein
LIKECVDMQEKLKGLLVVEKFFERTPNGPVLVGSKCKECGKVFFPKKKVCTRCFRDDTLELHPLAKKGRIITYSISHHNNLGIPMPYAFAYVFLPDDDIIIYSLLKDWDPAEEKLFCGQEVEQCMDLLRTDAWGNKIITYKYRPVGTKESCGSAGK